jgi:hypothetical protein
MGPNQHAQQPIKDYLPCWIFWYTEIEGRANDLTHTDRWTQLGLVGHSFFASSLHGEWCGHSPLKNIARKEGTDPGAIVPTTLTTGSVSWSEWVKLHLWTSVVGGVD